MMKFMEMTMMNDEDFDFVTPRDIVFYVTGLVVGVAFGAAVAAVAFVLLKIIGV